MAKQKHVVDDNNSARPLGSAFQLIKDLQISDEQLQERANKGEKINISNGSEYSTENFAGDSQYDEGLRKGSNQNLLRANNQGVLDELGNVTARTVKVLPGIASTVGTLVDLENVGGVLGIVQTDYNNWLTKWAEQQKQNVDEALPLYRENPNKTTDIQDSAWWLENIDGVKNSVIEFGITGLGVSAGTSAIAKGLQANKLLKGIGTAIDKGNQFTTALALTHAEGVITGIDVFEKTNAHARENLVFDNIQNQIIDKKDIEQNSLSNIRYRPLNDDEVKTLASDAASTAVRTNYANTLLNITSLNPLFNSKAASRALQNKALKQGIGETLESQADRLANLKWKDLRSTTLTTLGREVPQESLEEGINVYAQNQGLAKGKVISQEDASLTNSLFSEEGLNSMLWGALGAVGQTGTLKVAGKLKDKIFGETPDSEQTQFQNQRDLIVDNIRSKNSIVNRMNDIVEKQKTIAILENTKVETEEQAKEKEAQLDLLKADLQSDVMYTSFSKGTGENLHDIVNSYSTKTKDEFIQEDNTRTEQDWKDYQEGSKSIKENLQNNEKYYNKIQDSYYYMDNNYKKNLYNLKVTKDSLGKEKEKSEIEKLDLTNLLQEQYKDYSNIDDKTVNEIYKSDEERGQNNTKLRDLNIRIDKIDKGLESLNKQEEELTSDKFIQNYNKKKQEKVEKEKKEVVSQEQKKDNNDKINQDKTKVDKAKQKIQDLDIEISKSKPTQDDLNIVKNQQQFENVPTTSLQQLENEAKEFTETGKLKELNIEKQENQKIINEEEKNEISRNQFNNDNKVEVLEDSELSLLNKEINNIKNSTSPINKLLLNDGIIEFGLDEGIYKKVNIQTIANSTRIQGTNDFNSSLTLSNSLKDKDIIQAKIDDSIVDSKGNYTISLYKDKTKIGAIHIQDYIDNGGIAPTIIDSEGDELDNIDLQTQKLKILRDSLYSQLLSNGKVIPNQTVDLQVTGKSHGFIFNLKDKNNNPEYISLNDALVDDLEIVFVKSTGFYVGQDLQSNKEFIQSNDFKNTLLSERQGSILLSVPTPNGKYSLQFVKVPSFQDEKLDNIKNKVKNAMYSWIYPNSDSSKNFKNENNINNKEQFQEFVNNYIYTTLEESDGYQLAFDYTDNIPSIQISNFDTFYSKDGKNVNKKITLTSNNKPETIIKFFEDFFIKKNKNLNVNINNINTNKLYKKELNDLLQVSFKGNKIEEVENEIAYFANPIVSYKLAETNNKLQERPISIPIASSTISNITHEKKPSKELEEILPKEKNVKIEPKKVRASLPEESKPLEIKGLVKGFTGTEQRDILNSFLPLFDKHFRNVDKKEQSYNSLMNKVKNSLIELKDFVTEKQKENIEKVINDFDELSIYFQYKLKQIGITIREQNLEFLENKDIENVNQNDIIDDISGLDEADGNGLDRENNHTDGLVFETNSFSNIGAKLKILLSKISSGEISSIGTIKYIDPEIIYSDLMNLFQNANFTGESKLDLLLGNFKPHLEQVYNLVNNADNQTYYQFNRAFNYVKNVKEIVQIIKNEGVEGDYITKVMSSNQSTLDKQLLNYWLEPNLEQLYSLNEETNIISVNKEYIENIVKPKFQSLKENNSPKNLKEYLDLLGININIETLEELKKNIDNKHDFTLEVIKTFLWDDMFKNKGLVWFINNSFVNNNQQEEQSIKKLAEYVAYVSNNTTNGSYKNIEGKTIYGYTINNRLISKLKDIKNNFDSIIGKLNNTSLLKSDEKGSSFSYFLNVNKDILLNKVMSNQSFLDNISINPIDGIKTENDKYEFSTLSISEQERLKVDYFTNGNKQYGKTGINIAKVITLAKSDKSTGYSMEFILPKRILNIDSSLSEEVNTIIIGYMMSEYNRYYSAQEYNKQNLDNTIQKQFPQYNPTKFYLFPFLNNSDIYTANGELLPINEDIKSKMLEGFNIQLNNDIKNQITKWNDFGIIQKDKLIIDSNYKSAKLESLTNNDQILQFTKQYIIGNYIGNMEYIYLFSSDPATTAKKDVSKTLAEYFKRLTKEISPYEPLENNSNSFYNNFVLEDEIIPVEENIQNNWKENGVPQETIDEYQEINVADAAEYVTIKEHIFMLRNYGKITDKQYTEIQTQLGENNKGKLNFEQLKLVLTVLKPLQVGSTFVTLGNHRFEQSTFVKSAQFPLIPQLIKGSKLEGLLSFMQQHNVDRVPLQSAVKQGSKKRIKLNDIINNREQLDNEFKTNSSQYVTQLPRKYMGLQQETPYEANKTKILQGSQLAKLIHNSIDKKLSQGINDIETQLLDIRYNEWKVEVLNDKGEIDINKLGTRLLKFAQDRDWSISELQYLQLNDEGTDFKIPLWASINTSKIESLIVSDLNNNVIKQKLPGFSGLLGSTLGIFEQWKDTAIKSSIITVGDWKMEDGLKPMRFDESGKVLPAQILVPPKITLSDGKVIDIRKYVINGKLDISKVDENILKIIGYRIPTQGYNSMAYLEIVGFLPTYAGDLVIMPKEFVVQMGQDFDIDKLYIHQNHAIETEEGLQVNNSDKTKELENRLVNAYKHVLSSKAIFNQIVKPVNGGDLSKVADEIEKIIPEDNSNLIITPYQQTLNYYKGTLAKSGVGKTSLLSTLNSLFRNKNIELLNKKGNKYNRLFRGKDISNLSNPETVTSRLKSDVILEIQSIVVDHIKELKADKINYNDFTHDSMAALIMMGEDWDFIGYLLPQESIKNYVIELQKLQSEKVKNKEKIAAFNTRNILINKLNDLELESFSQEEVNSINVNDKFNNDNNYLSNLLKFSQIPEKSNNKLRDYYLNQIAILDDFISYDEIGKQLFNVQMGLTTTKSAGKNFLETLDKIDKSSMLLADRITNKENLLDETPIGKATDIIKEFNKLYKNTFPYNSTLYKNIFDSISKIKANIQDKKIVTSLTVEEKRNVSKFIRASAFSKLSNDVDKDRERLLFTKNGNLSIGLRWTNYLKNNPDSYFNNRVFTTIGIKGKSATLKFVNVSGSGMESDADITLELITMLESSDNKIKKLAEDTILYNFLIGGNQDAFNIIKYIPAEYLVNIGFKDLININFNNGDSNIIDTIVKQYIQHNPKEFTVQDDIYQEKYTSKFIAKYNKKSYIYEVYENKNGFKQIPVLGKDGFLETDINNIDKVSIYSKNNPKEYKAIEETINESKEVFAGIEPDIKVFDSLPSLPQDIESEKDLGEFYEKHCK